MTIFELAKMHRLAGKGGGGTNPSGSTNDVVIYGNLSQAYSPTPEHPVPIECVKKGTKIAPDVPMTTTTAWINATNQLSYSSDSFSVRLAVNASTQYELYLDSAVPSLFRAGVTSSEAMPTPENPITLSPCVRGNNPEHITLNTGASAKYIWIQISAAYSDAIYDLTVTDKSKGKTYKPFMRNTVPCNLYEGDWWKPTTKELYCTHGYLELDGTEKWDNATKITSCFSIDDDTLNNKYHSEGGTFYSNIAVGGFNAPPTNRHGTVFCSNLVRGRFGFGYTSDYTLAEWEAYLAEMKANETPVYIVYDLLEPITGNSPTRAMMSAPRMAKLDFGELEGAEGLDISGSISISECYDGDACVIGVFDEDVAEGITEGMDRIEPIALKEIKTE